MSDDLMNFDIRVVRFHNFNKYSWHYNAKAQFWYVIFVDVDYPRYNIGNLLL